MSDRQRARKASDEQGIFGIGATVICCLRSATRDKSTEKEITRTNKGRGEQTCESLVLRLLPLVCEVRKQLERLHWT